MPDLHTAVPRMLALRCRAAIRDMLNEQGDRFRQMHLRDALQLLGDADLELAMATDTEPAPEVPQAAE